MKLRHTLPLALAAVLLPGGLGCRKAASKTQADTRTATQLVEEAEALLRRGKWEDGRKLLRLLEENLPGSVEFPKAKLMLADSYFFRSTSQYPEALVEYMSFLNYFPQHEKRDYALYRAALCHYAAIENAERDQAETRQALTAFQNLLKETPGSPYAVDARAKVTQCWRRLAESELIVGIQYVHTYHFQGAETRLKGLLESYPDYADRERTYYYLGEAMRRKNVSMDALNQFSKEYLAKLGKEEWDQVSKEDGARFRKDMEAFQKAEVAKFREEARTYYQRLVESYPTSEWAGRAKDRLLEMGQAHIKENYDI